MKFKSPFMGEGGGTQPQIWGWVAHLMPKGPPPAIFEVEDFFLKEKGTFPSLYEYRLGRFNVKRDLSHIKWNWRGDGGGAFRDNREHSLSWTRTHPKAGGGDPIYSQTWGYPRCTKNKTEALCTQSWRDHTAHHAPKLGGGFTLYPKLEWAPFWSPLIS